MNDDTEKCAMGRDWCVLGMRLHNGTDCRRATSKDRLAALLVKTGIGSRLIDDEVRYCENIADEIIEKGWAEEDPAQISRLLFEAREAAEMLADIVEARTGKSSHHERHLVFEIDMYRDSRGWSPNGFGGEA